MTDRERYEQLRDAVRDYLGTLGMGGLNIHALVEQRREQMATLVRDE